MLLLYYLFVVVVCKLLARLLGFLVSDPVKM